MVFNYFCSSHLASLDALALLCITGVERTHATEIRLPHLPHHLVVQEVYHRLRPRHIFEKKGSDQVVERQTVIQPDLVFAWMMARVVKRGTLDVGLIKARL